MTRFAVAATILAALATAAPARADSTLAKVHAAGSLACGVVTEETDYTKLDTHGGLDDLGELICRAVTVAALGNKARGTVTRFPDEELAFKALAAGQVDLLVGVTPSASNAALYRAAFGPPVFIDGQGFMVRKTSGIHTLRDLAGKGLCYLDSTEAETRVMATVRERGIKAMLHPWSETGEMDAGLVSGHCDAMTGDVSMLAEERAAFHDQKQDFVILPETITLDPAAPAVRQGDAQWAGIVTWTVAALLQAEASGVTQANVATMGASEDPEIRRLVGGDHAAGRALGLPDDWAAAVIAAVGNYGELYARTIGPGTELNLPRGVNALWKDGGLLYPWPVR
jgi:general L-amino acid transport system substrate-binding protein